MLGHLARLKSTGMGREARGCGTPTQGKSPAAKDPNRPMPRRRANRLSGISWLWGSALALVLAGCASLGAGIGSDATKEQKEKAVAARAEARWAALIKGDLDSAYTFLSPGSKAATSLALYKSKVKPGIWRGAKAQKVTCDADVCQVTMAITYDIRQFKGIETPLAENWIIEKGAAWYVYR